MADIARRYGIPTRARHQRSYGVDFNWEALAPDAGDGLWSLLSVHLKRASAMYYANDGEWAQVAARPQPTSTATATPTSTETATPTATRPRTPSPTPANEEHESLKQDAPDLQLRRLAQMVRYSGELCSIGHEHRLVSVDAEAAATWAVSCNTGKSYRVVFTRGARRPAITECPTCFSGSGANANAGVEVCIASSGPAFFYHDCNAKDYLHEGRYTQRVKLADAIRSGLDPDKDCGAPAKK